MSLLFQRPGSPYWHAHLNDPRQPDGIRRKSTGKKTKAEALREAKRLQDVLDVEIETELEVQLNSCGLVWTAGLSLFLEQGDLRDSTRNAYVLVGETITKLLGDFDLGQLTHERLRWYCQQRRLQTVKPYRATDTGRRVSDPTIRKELSLISAVFKHLMELAIANAPKVNPLQSFDRKFLKNSKITDKHLRPAQFADALAACKTQVHRTMLTLMVGTGMRTGEVLDLFWPEVDFTAMVIEFGNVDSERTKSSRSRRVVVLQPVLDELTAHRTAQLEAGEYDPKGRVFPSFRKDAQGQKTAVRRADLKYLIKMVRSRTGAKRYVNHGLRHTFASWSRQQGIDPDAIRRALGHTTTSTTDRYAHHVDDSAMAQLRTLGLPSTAQSTAQSSAFPSTPISEKD